MPFDLRYTEVAHMVPPTKQIWLRMRLAALFKERTDPVRLTVVLKYRAERSSEVRVDGRSHLAQNSGDIWRVKLTLMEGVRRSTLKCTLDAALDGKP